MGVIDVIFSGPFPVILSIGLNVLLAAGYWFYGFPLAEEVKNLRRRSSEFDSSYIQSAESIKDMREVVDRIFHAVDRPHSSAEILAVATVCDSIMASINDLRVNVGREDPRNRAEMSNSLDNIERNSERILRALAEVSEKQSQSTGILLGINLQRGSPPRGV